MVEDARIVAWAAYRGNINLLKKAIEICKISPAMECFKKRNFVLAAILGRQFNAFEYLLSFNYNIDESHMNKVISAVPIFDNKNRLLLH
jgi:hypothetical protein